MRLKQSKLANMGTPLALIFTASMLAACASSEPEKDPIFEVTGQQQQPQQQQNRQ